MTTAPSDLVTKIPLLDLNAQYAQVKSDVDAAVAEVFNSQQFIMGEHVRRCEQEISRYCDCSHAVGVSSGTDALIVALMAEGIGPGDEVITTPYSFFATAGCIARVGATPVFVDIDPTTFNIDPGQISAKITTNTKAIIPVHLFGQMADMDPIMEIANQYQLAVIEDAAQAIGAQYRGRRAGSVGHYGCFSFFPSKNLAAAGDGGMVTTNDPLRAERLSTLRTHGAKPKYFHKVIGGNFRLDAIQAAVVTAKLPYLDRWTSLRQQHAALYDLKLTETGLVERADIILPTVREERHVFNQYVIRAKQRDELSAYLSNHHIATAIYYPRSLHEQECFANLGYRPTDCPESSRAAAETLALPVFPELGDEQIERVCEAISHFYRSGTRS